MKIKLLAVALASAFVMAGCTSINVDPGEQAVLTDQPFIFGSGGVRPNPVMPGNFKTWLSTDYTLVNMKPQAFSIAYDDFSSKDHVILDIDATVMLQITDSVTLVSKFGKDWFTNNVKGPLNQMVRDVVKVQSVSDMMSNPTTAVDMDSTVQKELTQSLKEQGVPVKVVMVTLGRVKPNDVVLKQMNATAAQQQRQLTEQASAVAEVARKDAETKRAEADDAYRQNLGYTTQQYVQMQVATIESQACAQAKECIIVPSGGSVVVAGSTK